MQRSLTTLNSIQQKFIDLIYVQKKTFVDASILMDEKIEVIRQLNKDLESHWRPITKSFNKWKAKHIGGSFWDFNYWSITTEPRCHYCGITQENLTLLHTLGLVNNKRATRGKTLEIDRKNPNEPYSNIQNLTYSCYWCNNAKTDTFTEEEFLIVGEAISKIWKSRQIY
ncbi:MAG TPA: hypothetical protein VGC01_05390 [Mucilaginibacter sp.]